MNARGASRGGGSFQLRCCLTVLLLGMAPAALAQPAAVQDRERVALIERVSKSVVWVRSIVKEPPPPAAPAGPRAKRPELKIEDFQRMLRGDRPKREEGSGFVIDGERGLILTAAHIVARSKSVTVGLPGGGEWPAQIVGIDPDGGLALLRIAHSNLPPLELAERDARAGERAIIIGWMIPLKSVMPIEGMVMGPAPGAAQSASASPLADYVALDVVIPNGGFGGSPVVDSSGAAIGFVSAIYGRDYGPGTVTLMIPSRGLRPLIDELAAQGRIRRGGIGVGVDCYRLPCVIDSVEAGAPAHLAGLGKGDALVAVDGVKIESESQLQRAVARQPVGSNITLTVTQAGRQRAVTIKSATSR